MNGVYPNGTVTCCTERPLSLRRYEHMTNDVDHYPRLARPQLPLGVLIGKSIKFGTVGHEKRRRTSARDPRFYPGVVWASWLHRLCVPLLVTKSGTEKVAQRLLLFPCRNFSVRPREYQRRISDHTPLGAFGFQLEHAQSFSH